MMTALSANDELLELISSYNSQRKRDEIGCLFLQQSVQAMIGDKEKSMNCFHDFSSIHNAHNVGKMVKENSTTKSFHLTSRAVSFSLLPLGQQF